MEYPFSDLSARVPVEERDFDSYYADRLYSMDTLVVTLFQSLYKPDAEGSVLTFLETMSMAHLSAQDRMAEVEEYIRQLEAKVASFERCHGGRGATDPDHAAKAHSSLSTVEAFPHTLAL